jgi:hypothetical protein
MGKRKDRDDQGALRELSKKVRSRKTILSRPSENLFSCSEIKNLNLFSRRKFEISIHFQMSQLPNCLAGGKNQEWIFSNASPGKNTFYWIPPNGLAKIREPEL